MLLYHISYYETKVLYLKQKYIAQMLFALKMIDYPNSSLNLINNCAFECGSQCKIHNAK